MPAADAIPIACTLGLAEMEPRLARIRQLTREHLRSHRLDGNALYLRYDGTAVSEVEHIMGLERQCCAFLDFTLSPRGDEVELLIVGPAQVDRDAHWLFSQFLPQPSSDAPIRECACCKG